MKYVLIIVGIVVCICLFLSFRLGYNDCVARYTETQLENKKTIDKNNQAIEQRVMSIPDDDNFNWLLQNYRRAN